MSNATQQFKAQQRRQKFADLLREMFQLNQPELDFGLYRIMHARKDDINRFIEQDLPRITQEAFSQYASQDQAQLEAELEEHIKSAKGLGMDPDAIPKVQELKQKLQGGFDLAREEGKVYDALVTFFNRYYNEGDFLSRRVYKDGTYAIPYQGEEVVLHWANKDQYYIKSSETLRDYSFRLNPDAGPGEDPMRVHFKLVDAEAGAKDNNKESTDSRRVFVLEVEKPFELIEGEATEHGDQYTELQCRFVFRPATESDWTEAEKKKATAAAQKKPPTQDALRAIAEDRLLGVASEVPEPWKSALAKPYRKADGNRVEYSILAGQLNNYTKKNTFDYFIHKDLAGFLTRELDFYIKNELLDWEDLASLKNDTAKLAPLLSKIEVIRVLGEKIINFLAQLENFQRKLWLKKKFVTETDYCITLDHIECQPQLLEEVFSNDLQLKNWESLYGIDLKELEKDRFSLTWKELIKIKKYRFMIVDTSFFNANFKASLLSNIEGLDKRCDGLLVKSENFQALNFLQERYRSKIKCTYIDPPYNTGNDDFLYKDQFQHSSWLSAINASLRQGRELLSSNGVTYVSLDDQEQPKFRLLGDEVFGEGCFIANIIWEKNFSPRNTAKHYSENHDYIICYAKNINEFEIGLLPRSKEAIERYSNVDNDPRGPWTSGDLTARNFYSEGTYEVVAPGGKIFKPAVGNYWRVSKENFQRLDNEGRIHWGSSGNSMPRVKRYLSDVKDGVTPVTIWGYRDVGHTQEAKKELVSVSNFASSSDVFNTVKPTRLIERVIQTSGVEDTDIVLDYFGGSGSTAHAVVNYNRKNSSSVKYILIEMGDYLDSIIKPRLARVVYSEKWKNGSPEFTQSNYGVSQIYKCIRLETFEDVLGNLSLYRNNSQQELLNQFRETDNSEARHAYLMNYMLEVETRGSQSLLNINNFLEPNNYELKVRSAGGDETKPMNVDLLETFNYLLGLEVEHIAAPIHFEADLNRAEFGRWEAKVKRSETGKWWFRTVYGTNRAGQQVLVVWRNLPSVIDGDADGIQKDNAILDAVLIEKLAIRLTESQDDEIDVLYVNGDHNISIPRSRKGAPMEQARIQLIEEAFHRLMFADTEAVH